MKDFWDVSEKFNSAHYKFRCFLDGVSLMSSIDVEENISAELKNVISQVELIEKVNGGPFLGYLEISGVPGRCEIIFSKAAIKDNSIAETVREYIENSSGNISQRVFELFKRNYQGSFSALCGEDKLVLSGKEYRALGPHNRETISLINGRVCCVEPSLFKYNFENYDKIIFRVIPEEVVMELYALRGCESDTWHCGAGRSDGTSCT